MTSHTSQYSFMPQFPIYIPTKGRSEYMITSKALTAMGVRHSLIVEEPEVEKYIRAIDDGGLDCDILTLCQSYKEKYELCDDLGLSKSTGPGPARNFAWDHAISIGSQWHWVMDDNIQWFYRFNNNLKTPCRSPGMWRAMEDFVCRYENVAMAGPNYFMFAARKQQSPAFVINTRIYSCNLIRNDIPFRWRGRYNEDTILSLDILKAGHCTVQFNAFLQDKMKTQIIPGGNTGEFYWKEGVRIPKTRYADGGTDAKSEMLARVHPDVATVRHRFGRTHHHVNYSVFTQQLKLRDDIVPHDNDNEYGMKLRNVEHYRCGW